MIFLTAPGQFLPLQPLPEFISDEFVCMEMINYHRFTLGVIGLLHRGDFQLFF